MAKDREPAKESPLATGWTNTEGFAAGQGVRLVDELDYLSQLIADSYGLVRGVVYKVIDTYENSHKHEGKEIPAFYLRVSGRGLLNNRMSNCPSYLFTRAENQSNPQA